MRLHLRFLLAMGCVASIGVPHLAWSLDPGPTLELSEVRRVGRLVAFPPAGGPAFGQTWVLPTAFHSRLDCAEERSEREARFCLLRIFNSATAEEAASLGQSLPMGEGPGSPIVDVKSRIDSPLALPGSGAGGALRLDPLQFRSASEPLAVLGFRYRPGVDPEISALFDGAGLGELSIDVQLRARRTHEFIAFQDRSALSELASVARTGQGLGQWARSQAYVLRGVEPDEAPAIVARLLEWRMLPSAPPSALTRVMLQTALQPLRLQCRVRLIFKREARPSIQCQEVSS